MMMANNRNILVLFLAFLHNYDEYKAFCIITTFQFSMMNRATQYNALLEQKIMVLLNSSCIQTKLKLGVQVPPPSWIYFVPWETNT